VKKITSRGVKRVSSTTRADRPKQTVGVNALNAVPEPDLSMKPDVNPKATAAGGTPASGRVVLGVACTIHQVQALRAHMIEQAALPGPYELDGGEVQQVDTAGVQLVVAFALDCLERGITYSWKRRSPVFDEAVRVLGVAALLESPG
jgi:hypothetical protein